MKKVGRPANPFKNSVPGVDEVTDRRERPEDHEIEDWMRTLEKAEGIKKDSDKMAHVHEASGKKIRSFKSLKAMAGRKMPKPF